MTTEELKAMSADELTDLIEQARKERRRKTSQEWEKNNPEKRREYARKYQEKNRDRLKAYNRAYYFAHFSDAWASKIIREVAEREEIARYENSL